MASTTDLSAPRSSTFRKRAPLASDRPTELVKPFAAFMTFPGTGTSYTAAITDCALSTAFSTSSASTDAMRGVHINHVGIQYALVDLAFQFASRFGAHVVGEDYGDHLVAHFFHLLIRKR